ncbi:MAG: hypothetical protein DRO39_02945 [Thermoprotei archaeon]|nr:MAG: hypothetical protein DRO39_02945 [Thermoprotei archaeon]
MDGLVDVVRKAEELYNRYRAPEAVARVLKIDGDRVVVQFTGSFHYTCGLYDWLEDMKYVLEDLGVEAHMERAEEAGDGTWVAIYRVRQRTRARGSSGG